MTNEQLLMQKRAGLLSESEYQGALDEFNLDKTSGVKSDLKRQLLQLAKQLDMMKSFDPQEVKAFSQMIQSILDTLQKDGMFAPAIQSATKAFTTRAGQIPVKSPQAPAQPETPEQK